jgi:ABC-type Fe3+/spermidine/putrescine transport system ATPase subunit
MSTTPGQPAMPPVEAPSPGVAGALSIRGVVKRFGTVAAVDNVDLDLPAGSFFSLLGPSGCGKTTLLRVVAGLEQPDAGRVLVDGIDITRQPPERRPFNMVFQRYALFPHLSVYDNIAFGLTTRSSEKLPAPELRRRVIEMLDLVGLAGYETRWPGQLSGGQQQRVAVARALMRRPRVLLLDEPMAALDRNVRHQVREELLRIHADLGTTFLLVTHDQDEALSISSQVALMNLGRIEQLADPETLYRRPATLFAAKFVGAGSFLAASVVGRRDGRPEVRTNGLAFTAEDGGARDGEAAVVLLRPEDLLLVAPGAGRIAGAVETCAFFGSYYELRVQTPLGLIRLRDKRAAAPGDTVGVTWPDIAGIAYPPDAATAVVDIPAGPASTESKAHTG